MKRIRVLLADDHTLVRAGFRSLLETIPDVEVVGEAADGHEALDLAAEHRPDVVVLDVALPGLNGLEVAERLGRTQASTRALMLSMHANEEYVHRALAAGAAGYLLKDADRSELDLALRAVARGEVYLSPAISKRVVGDYLEGRVPDDGSIERLTPRQREVLQLIAEGHSTKDIAQRLGLSVKTIETHRAQLMDRLDIHDVAGLVRYAIRRGIIHDPG